MTALHIVWNRIDNRSLKSTEKLLKAETRLIVSLDYNYIFPAQNLLRNDDIVPGCFCGIYQDIGF